MANAEELKSKELPEGEIIFQEKLGEGLGVIVNTLTEFPHGVYAIHKMDLSEERLAGYLSFLRGKNLNIEQIILMGRGSNRFNGDHAVISSEQANGAIVLTSKRDLALYN